MMESDIDSRKSSDSFCCDDSFDDFCCDSYVSDCDSDSCYTTKNRSSLKSQTQVAVSGDDRVLAAYVRYDRQEDAN